MWNSNDRAFVRRTIAPVLCLNYLHGKADVENRGGSFSRGPPSAAFQPVYSDRIQLLCAHLFHPFIPILLIPRLYRRHTVLISWRPEKATCPRRPERLKFSSHQMHSLNFFFFSSSLHYLSKSSPINSSSACGQVLCAS